MGFELRNDKVKKGTGSGSKNVTWTYVGGDEKTANIRTAEITTTTPGSGFAGTGVGYGASFAKLTPEQKIKFNTPDLPSYKKYVIDFNKAKSATTSTETITQNREDWTKTFKTWGGYVKNLMETGGYNWKFLANKINTGGEGPDTNFSSESIKSKFDEVGYDKFKVLVKKLYPHVYSKGTGGSSSRTVSGKGSWQ